MAYELYLEKLTEKLQQAARTQGDRILAAAQALADCIASGGKVWTFGCGHSALLAQDLYYRAGGLVPVECIFGAELLLHRRPVSLTSQFERLEGYAHLLLEGSKAKAGDVIIVISTSGINVVPVEMALLARQRGLKVIGLTSVSYSAGQPSRHPSGKKLADAADVILDNGADPGDGVVALPGLEQKLGPVSTAIGSALLQAVVVETAAQLLERGIKPPIFMSANAPGGEEHNVRLLRQYEQSGQERPEGPGFCPDQPAS